MGCAGTGVVSPMHIALGSRLSMTKWSGREEGGCVEEDEDAAPAPVETCPLAVPLDVGFDEDGSRDPLEDRVSRPHAQHSCVRRAGLGNVLYVEPNDVYLSPEIKTLFG